MNLWELPGPRGWLGTVGRTIADRTSCLIVAPSHDNPVSLRDGVHGVADDAEFRAVPADLPPDALRNPELVSIEVARHLGIAIPPGARFGSGDLVGHPDTDANLVFVDARDTDPPTRRAWVEFASACASAGVSLRPGDRCAVTIAVTPADIAVPDQDTNLRILWWWGVLGPLDIDVWLSQYSHPNQARPAMIAEVARWDLDLATRLATRWNGTREGLAHFVTLAPDLPVPASKRSGIFPDSNLLGWTHGWFESWAGRVAWIPTCEDDLDRRLWSGQIRAIYPWLEEFRAWAGGRIAPLLRNKYRLSPHVVEETVQLELGPLLARCDDEGYKLPYELRDALRKARRTRNDLAHFTVVSPAKVAELYDAAARAGF